MFRVSAGRLQARAVAFEFLVRPGLWKPLAIAQARPVGVGARHRGAVAGHYDGWDQQRKMLAEARDYVLEQAATAAELNTRVFTVSVGAYADVTLMDEVAATTGGEHLGATDSDIDTYQEHLREIFVRLGGERPVELMR